MDPGGEKKAKCSPDVGINYRTSWLLQPIVHCSSPDIRVPARYSCNQEKEPTSARPNASTCFSRIGKSPSLILIALTLNRWLREPFLSIHTPILNSRFAIALFFPPLGYLSMSIRCLPFLPIFALLPVLTAQTPPRPRRTQPRMSPPKPLRRLSRIVILRDESRAIGEAVRLRGRMRFNAVESSIYGIREVGFLQFRRTALGVCRDGRREGVCCSCRSVEVRGWLRWVR